MARRTLPRAAAPSRSRLAAALALVLSVLATPLVAGAQASGRVPRIGLLFTGAPPPESSRSVEAFRRGLRDLGYVEGRTIVLECRWAREGESDRLPNLVAELVHLGVDVIVTQTGGQAQAAQRVTSTTPIVFGVSTVIR